MGAMSYFAFWYTMFPNLQDGLEDDGSMWIFGC